MSKFINLVGQKFGRLTVIKEFSVKVKSGRNRKYFDCSCDCGVRKSIRADAVKSGKAKSCGCYHLEVITKHSSCNTVEYHSWDGMKGRCYRPRNKDYYNYGARGITVCSRWLESFENFFNDMGFKPSSNHSIDRIDNYGNYEPTNCRWASIDEQAINRRNTRYLWYKGASMTVREWSVILGIKIPTINNRLHLGWSIERTLTEKVNHNRE